MDKNSEKTTALANPNGIHIKPPSYSQRAIRS